MPKHMLVTPYHNVQFDFTAAQICLYIQNTHVHWATKGFEFAINHISQKLNIHCINILNLIQDYFHCLMIQIYQHRILIS